MCVCVCVCACVCVKGVVMSHIWMSHAARTLWHTHTHMKAVIGIKVVHICHIRHMESRLTSEWVTSHARSDTHTHMQAFIGTQMPKDTTLPLQYKRVRKYGALLRKYGALWRKYGALLRKCGGCFVEIWILLTTWGTFVEIWGFVVGILGSLARVHVLKAPTATCAAVCCSVLQCVAVCCSVLQCVAVCCSVLQCVAVCCSVSPPQCVDTILFHTLLQCVTACYSVLQWVVVCRHSDAVRWYFPHAHPSHRNEENGPPLPIWHILIFQAL